MNYFTPGCLLGILIGILLGANEMQKIPDACLNNGKFQYGELHFQCKLEESK